MKIKYILPFYFFLSQSYSYALEQKDLEKNEILLFMKNYLEKNKKLLSNIDEVCGSCEEKYCEFELLEKKQVIYLYNVRKNFDDNTKEEKLTLSKYYGNGSYIETESIFLQKSLKRVKRADYFKPSIDGSWLANERSILLRLALEKLKKNDTKKENKNESDKKIKDAEQNKNTTVDSNFQEPKKNKYFFKPSIDGSWLANERAILLRNAKKKLEQKDH